MFQETVMAKVTVYQFTNYDMASDNVIKSRRWGRVAFYEPKRLAQKKYYPRLSMSREMRWIDKAKPEPEQLMSNGDVVEKVIEQFLSLVDRVDRGQIPAIRH
jgi:hypothetical protein